jgi:hypothetical protein
MTVPMESRREVIMTLDWKQLVTRVNAVFHAHEAIGRLGAVPLVMNALYHVGAAAVALDLIENVQAPDRRRVLDELFTAPPDLLDWTAFSLGTRSVVSALDVCAAAVWRLSGGQPLHSGRERDLDEAFRMRARLTSGPLVSWLVLAHDSAEYPTIREFRHGFTHRQVSRHIKIFLGEDRSEFVSEVGSSRQTAAAHLRTAVPFAVNRFSAFCDAAIEQFQ